MSAGKSQAAATQQRALPDVNAQTYPYDRVQHLLDQTADLSLMAVPDPELVGEHGLTPGDPEDYFGINGGYGWAIGCRLHPFESILPPGATGRLEVEQTIGTALGSLRARWLLGAGDFPWRPGHEPPPAMWDPWSPQRFAMLDCVFELGEGDGFTGYGIGRTYPVVAGRPLTLVGAVGNVMEGRGRFAGLEGTFVLTGRIERLGFLGNITCRLVDFSGQVRGEGDLPSPRPISDPSPGSTFVELRGVKRDASVRTTYGPPPDERRVSLITPSVVRSVRVRQANPAGRGLRSVRSVGQIVGSMEANVFFDLLAPPGTAERPVPFTTDEHYELVDGSGQTLGTLQAGVEEGISFNLQFPSAPGQPGVRFAGFGPIHGGTGALAGAAGLLTVNSVIGIAPHALSLLHVLHVVEPDLRPSARRAGSGAGDRALPREDHFAPLLERKTAFTGRYLDWRHKFRRCAAGLAPALVELFESIREVGEFPGLSIDADVLRRAFEAGVKPFDPHIFDRYLGRARGEFRVYRLDDRREIDRSILYSEWDRENFVGEDGRIGKRISGSHEDYFSPRSLPDPAEGKVDLILNSWRQDVGVTSWVEIFQGGRRQQRSSIAYTLPGPHEVMWMVKDVSIDQRPVEDDVFMASHEWKGQWQGKTAYFMVGLFVEIDFERCSLRQVRDSFWRALYTETADG